MGTSKHTPGPWSLPHFAEPDVNCECGYVLVDHLMGAVATVHCSGKGEDWIKHGDNPRFAEAVANARLIQSSPDMLEALRHAEAILSYAPEMSTNKNGAGPNTSTHHALRLVRDAIAKAEGRS